MDKKAKKKIIPAYTGFQLEGPKPRINEFKFALQIFFEFIKGFRALHFIGPCVTVFGSARFKEDHMYYKQARELGKRIAELGMVTMTGGGPGIMEAANRGAFEAGVKVASGFPGTPSTEVMDYTQQGYPGIYCEWSTNEKVGLEVAIGASFAGCRSFAVMKTVGLHVAADALGGAAGSQINGVLLS